MPTFSKNLFGLYEEAITGLVKTYPNNKGMKKSSSCIAAILKKPNGANQSCCTFECWACLSTIAAHDNNTTAAAYDF